MFLQLDDDTSTFFSWGGVLFFAPVRGSFDHGRGSRFTQAGDFVQGLALTLVDVPITLLTQVVFSILAYFLVGLQQSAGQFL